MDEIRDRWEQIPEWERAILALMVIGVIGIPLLWMRGRPDLALIDIALLLVTLTVWLAASGKHYSILDESQPEPEI